MKRLALLVLVIGAAAPVVAGAQTADKPLLTAPVWATRDDVDATRTYTSPSIAVDPEDPNHVAMAYVEARTRRCGLLMSTDAGQHWSRLDASPSPASYPFCFVISGNVDM